jgi:pimeloyl-ACP methyl ester carboxylesterase
VSRRTPAGVAYEVHGEGAAVVLVHGLTLDRHTWAPVIAALGKDVRAIAIDLPLHGESRSVPGGIDEAARAVIAVLDEESAVDPILVGHSLGAVVVASVAASRPVRAAIHVDQALHLGDFNRLVRAAVDARPPPPTLAQLMPGFRDRLGLDKLAPDDRTLVEAHCDPREEVFLAYWGDLLVGDPDELDEQTAGWLRASSAPLLAIHAREPGDRYRAWLSEVAPRSTIELWPEGGHFPHLARPEAFATAIRARL